jgi:hypothetical protein
VKKVPILLKEAQVVLTNLLENDKLDMEEATNNAWSVETILCVAYPHEGWSNWHPFIRIT